jgi:hypothetical protein
VKCAKQNKDFYLAPAIFPEVLKCPKIADANSLFFNIAGAKAPIAPMLNTPLIVMHVVFERPL